MQGLTIFITPSSHSTLHGEEEHGLVPFHREGKAGTAADGKQRHMGASEQVTEIKTRSVFQPTEQAHT